MSTIRILSGSYRNQRVVDEVFTLVKGFQTGKKGSYVTVKNEGQFAIAIAEVKVKVDSIEDIQFMNGEFNLINVKEVNEMVHTILTELNKIYNYIKTNSNIRPFSNPRFEIVVEEEEDIESGIVTKIGYVVDKIFKTNSIQYDITNINDAVVIGDISKSLNMITVN
jgi:hypothetical protein